MAPSKSISLKSLMLCTMILLIAPSCEDAPQKVLHELSALPALVSQDGMNYPESVQAWEELKAINGGSYIYQTTFTSWTGDGHTTEIRVDDGIVTMRAYQEFDANQSNGEKTIIYSYREVGADVGSNMKGAQPRTIDELYQTCASDFLTVDAESNTVYFETTNDGLMTICGFVPDGCVDDCFNGIRIHAFAWQN